MVKENRIRLQETSRARGGTINMLASHKKEAREKKKLMKETTGGGKYKNTFHRELDRRSERTRPLVYIQSSPDRNSYGGKRGMTPNGKMGGGDKPPRVSDMKSIGGKKGALYTGKQGKGKRNVEKVWHGPGADRALHRKLEMTKKQS